MKYLLIIILHSTVGVSEPAIFKGETTYSLSECRDLGEKMTEWLNQDFIKVEWQCIPS